MSEIALFALVWVAMAGVLLVMNMFSRTNGMSMLSFLAMIAAFVMAVLTLLGYVDVPL